MRQPRVSGAFYSSSTRALEKELKDIYSGFTKKPDEKILGGVVPHAGYIYSGRTAAAVYSRIPVDATYVILGPNHSMSGALIAASEDDWMTPMGKVELDRDLLSHLRKEVVMVDENAHAFEHSIEVQLPFLQYLIKSVKILPISMGIQDYETAVDVGDALSDAINAHSRKVVVLASSDFTHYQPEEVVKSIDMSVIKPILEMDLRSFFDTVYNLNASVCGYGPIGTVIHTLLSLGAVKGELVRYSTSAEASGDTRQVVGYGGIVFH